MKTEAFLAKFNSLEPEPNGCILWPRPNEHSMSRAQRAYRKSYEVFKGPIPEDKPFICHSCDNGRCVNPEHLWAGTHAENMADCARKGRLPWGKLKPDQVLEIRELYDMGVPKFQLAESFGVDEKTVCHIGRRKRWKELV